MKEEKKHVGRPTNEELVERRQNKTKKVILYGIIAVIVLFIIFSVGSAIFANNNTVKLGNTEDIKADSIKITVLSSEDVSIDEGELSLANGNYTKVKIKIENYGTQTYEWGLLNFSLGDEPIAGTTLTQSDLLKEKIAAGETATGYIYFEQTNESLLEYISSAVAVDENTLEVKKAYFRIK